MQKTHTVEEEVLYCRLFFVHKLLNRGKQRAGGNEVTSESDPD